MLPWNEGKAHPEQSTISVELGERLDDTSVRVLSMLRGWEQSSVPRRGREATLQRRNNQAMDVKERFKSELPGAS